MAGRQRRRPRRPARKIVATYMFNHNLGTYAFILRGKIMSQRKGLTLTELLIVIFTIALLIIFLIPSVHIDRPNAITTVCLANQKSLSLAWIMYADDHNGTLVGGNVSNDREKWPGCWTLPPVQDSNLSPLEQEQEGIRKGALFYYIKNVEPYNCPADKRWSKLGQGYRSYSIAAGLNGEQREMAVTKLEYIKTPDKKYVFVEETNPTGWTRGSWMLNPEGDSWIDPVAIRHEKGKVSTLSFADGHAEAYKWVDKRTLEMGQNQIPNQLQPDNPDLKYMQSGYAHK